MSWIKDSSNKKISILCKEFYTSFVERAVILVLSAYDPLVAKRTIYCVKFTSKLGQLYAMRWPKGWWLIFLATT